MIKKKQELNFDLKQIRSFLEILQENSFTIASRKLKIGQATISHHISSLEEILGVKLINRTGKEVSATREGKIFEIFCGNLFEEIDKLKAGFNENKPGGVIRLASSTVPSTYILPEVIAKIKKKQPEIYYSINITDSREAIERVKDGTAEIGIVGKRVKHPSLEYQKFFTDEIVLIGNMDFPDKIKINKIIELPFIIRESGSGTKTAYETVLKKYKIIPSNLNTVFECSTSEAVKESVASGIGVSFISKLAIAKELAMKKIKIINIEEFNVLRDFYMIHLKNKHLSQPARMLIDMLLK